MTKADPRRLECDLIMKGGVTSGLVYPGTIARIARDYRICSIGGTSAGALAAAGAAAMEHGIRTGAHSLDQALALMAALPVEASQKTDSGASLLEALFAADGSFQGPFDFIKQMLGPRRPRGLTMLAAIWRAAPRFLPAFLLATIAACLAGPVLLGLVLVGPLGVAPWLALSLAVLLAAVLPVLALWHGLATAGAELAARWHAQGWGLASGMATPMDAMDGKPLPGLTAWMHGTFQRLAGRPDTAPVTFGDLWAAGQPEGATGRAIDLALVATDLNRMQSVQFPYLPGNQRLFFDTREWATLFPDAILSSLEATTWQPATTDRPDQFRKIFGYGVDDVAAAARNGGDADRFAHLRLLPKGRDLPILVAARASMAFPGLFTPLPLWLLRWVGSGQQRQPVLSRVLLSDGGITSNFPIHLFDAPVPSRPTFAINLVYPDDEITGEPRIDAMLAADGIDRDTAAPRVVVQLRGGGDGGETLSPDLRNTLFMPASNAGMVQLYKAPPHGSPLARVGGFLSRVVEAARTWGDVSLYGQPGMRDRIIHVRLTDSEGGFNLGMDPATIRRLAAKGDAAGDVLARRFDPDHPEDPLNPGLKLRLNWHNHRFVRLRVYVAAQEMIAHRLTAGWSRVNDPQRPQSVPALDRLLREARGTMPPGGTGTPIGYSLTLTRLQRDHMQSLLTGTMALKPGQEGASALPGTPKPSSLMRLRPTGADPRESQP